MNCRLSMTSTLLNRLVLRLIEHPRSCAALANSTL